MSALAVGREGEGAVRKGKTDAAMGDAEPVAHFRSHGHTQTAITQPLFQSFDAEPLAEEVFSHHSVNNTGRLIFHRSIFRFVLCLYSPLNSGALFSRKACT